MDTRTPRHAGGRSRGFDDDPGLSTVKVPCDPAQVIVNHASFRVQLATPVPGLRARGGALDLSDLLATATANRAPASVGSGRRRAPVVWSGRTEPGDRAAGQLLRAVRNSGAGFLPGPTRAPAGGPVPGHGRDGGDAGDPGATQVLPRIRLDDEPPPTVIGPRAPRPDDTTLLRPIRPGAGPYGTGPGGAPYGPGRDADDYGDDETYGDYDGHDEREPADRDADAYHDAYGGRPGEYAAHGAYAAFEDEEPRSPRHGADGVRHAYYPGRRMNLGVVLLPLRVFLGFISVYAGMGKLCDPVYFDGGERGSMVTWLASLHPWGVASPLRDFALAHPVGSGLTVAFLQVVVGVLTIAGLWQRLAAAVGALLSAALLLTVSWRSVPVYDAPDIIYLAAWSPLLIAGAPVYSLDGRLAGEAWRRLGPRVPIWELRRRVLRRGGLMATLVVGLTLLTGSMLGGAVRSSDMTTVPGPTDAPRNHLPGSPVPRTPGADRISQGPSAGSRSPDTRHSTRPSASSGASSGPGTARETGSVGTGHQPGSQPPSASGSGGGSNHRPAPPSRTAGPTSTGGGSGGSSGGDGSGGGSDGGSDSGGALGGLLG